MAAVQIKPQTDKEGDVRNEDPAGTDPPGRFERFPNHFTAGIRSFMPT